MLRNFWINDDGSEKYPFVVACLNNVVLIDRRLMPTEADIVLRDFPKCRADYKPWLVYNCATEREYGNWITHKSRKVACEDLIAQAGRAQRDTVKRVVPDYLRKAMEGKHVCVRGDDHPMTPENIGT